MQSIVVEIVDIQVLKNSKKIYNNEYTSIDSKYITFHVMFNQNLTSKIKFILLILII